MITLLIISFIILLLTLLVSAYLYGVDKSRTLAGTIPVISLMLLIMGVIIIDFTEEQSYREGYKDGQIQAIIGNQHFQRQVQPDSTVIWVRIHN